MTLINSLIQEGWLKTPRIIEAFRAIKREDFLPNGSKDLAELNEALPIGFGQTISQPLTVAFMLEQLKPEPGDKILDIGSGSGWTIALLAHIVGERGKVIGIEIVPGLKAFGEKNVSKYNFIKKGIVKMICADGSKGYPQFAVCPELVEGFDAILASASAGEIPDQWRKQLKTGGRIVAPVKYSIWVLEKKSEKEWQETEHQGFVFVPLIQK